MGNNNTKGYSQQSLSDSQSVNLVRNLLTETRRIKTDIKSDDTTPNIDGYITILTEDGKQLGDFQVQVKTLLQKECFKFRDTSFFEYCRSQLQTPILLLCADLKKKFIYWEEMNETVIEGAIEGDLKVYFPKMNIISDDNKAFVEEWVAILEKQKTHTINSIRLKEILGETELGIPDEKNIYLHRFLDEYNTLLDTQFLRLKRIFYPLAWKIGVAYFKLEKEGCSYTFFPINIDENDIAIKRIPSVKKKETLDKYKFLISHAGNPFEADPTNYAREEIWRLFRNAFEDQEFNTLGSEYLAREYIFSFINRYHTAMGLKLQNSYTLEELEDAYFHYFPKWSRKAIEYLSENKRVDLEPSHQPFIDPKDLLDELRKEEKVFITNETIKESLESKNIVIPSYINSLVLPFRKFLEYIEYLEDKNITEVKYLYKNFDEENNEKREVINSNLRTFFLYRDSICRNFFNNNFQFLTKFMRPSQSYVYWDFTDKEISFENFRDLVVEEIEVFQGENKETNIIETKEDWDDLKQKYNINSKNPTIPITYGYNTIEFLMDEIPLHNFIYSKLEEEMGKYFKKILKVHH